ncbi:MAG: PQQ-dependent sugar dehydrogenase [Planctomycetaceae bacterium]
MQRGALIPIFLFVWGWASVPSRADDAALPYGLTKRDPWTTSKVVGTPEPPPPYQVERIYPELKFQSPVFIAQEPGSDRILVAELSGKIFAFSKTNPTADSKQLVLETKREIYAFSFHPRYEQNGQLFVFSPSDPKDPSPKKLSRVSRFRTTLEQPRVAGAESEEVIIEWPAGGHNGGEAIFGPDGCLYISTGDGTSGSDPEATGQGVNDFLSVMLRIEVDHPEPGKPYSIPPDNPFIHYPDARPEIWAHGFRNPWRISFDDAGRLWCGDVGQDLWEYVWLVERGGNLGWSVREGSHSFHPHKPVGPGSFASPIVEHHHSECRSITGGYVYHGAKHPELDGVYFYGDYEYGMIWGFRYDGKQAVEHRVLADTPLRIPTFAVTRDGEILLTDHLTGELYELVKAPPAEIKADFPKKLSDTGLFTSVRDHRLATGVLSYAVNTPQWIDNGEKERFVGLPGASKIKFLETSGNAATWEFEDGTVAAETISLELEEGNPASRRRIETRLLVKQQNHWLGYSYLWNDAQTDAELVGARGIDLPLQIQSAEAGGEIRQQTWHVPSRNECMVCHSRAAGFVLGLRTVQMNRPYDYQGTVDNQLRAWNHAEIFTAALPKAADEYASLKDPYHPAGAIEERARSYLEVNCAVCHVSDGGGNARMVLLTKTAPDEMKIFGEKPIHGDFGLSDAHLVTPGDPFASILFYRLSKAGRGRMPHVGSNLADERGLRLMQEWIQEWSPPDALRPEGHSKEPEDYHRLIAAFCDVASTPASRQTLINESLSSTRGALLLATAVAQKAIPAAARSEAIARGIAIPEANIRDLFERFIPESQRTRLLGDSFDSLALLQLQGNAERGRDLFFNAAGLQCRSCHRIGEVGGSFGADLNQIGKKFPRAELLESLVDPSKKVDPKYAAYVLVTHGGKVLTGLLVEKTEREVVLNTLEAGRTNLVRVPVEDVDELEMQSKSLMPERQLRDLTAQQAADLLEFLTTLK